MGWEEDLEEDDLRLECGNFCLLHACRGGGGGGGGGNLTIDKFSTSVACSG